MMPGGADFADWLAIANLKAAYCRLLDTKDWEGWSRLFTEDFVQDVSPGGGGVYHGREAAVAATRASIETARTAHQVHFPEITIAGDEARAIWPLQDRLIWEDGRSLTAYGHYHERYVRTAAGWRIAEQKLTRLLMDFDR
ncbi:MAG: nuclear transport factor 2 family protein [Novosphingobium sp.]|jgi:3-phenylpropionate/cinnamic acid dioxygenase small subunit|nr:nuclear transport factor 2 family protein [Novosphingobium sp.]